MSQARRKSKRVRGARRYRDETTEDTEPYSDKAPADDVEALEISDSEEEEIDIVHVRESAKQRFRRDLQEAAAKPSTRTVCWRSFLFLLVVSLGIAMIVQLYSSYGQFLTDQLFPPRVSSGGTVCSNGTVTKDYQLRWTSFETVDNRTAHTAGWAHLNATRPKDALQWAWRVTDPDSAPGTAPQLTDVRWKTKDTLLVWLESPTPDHVACANVIVLSV